MWTNSSTHALQEHRRRAPFGKCKKKKKVMVGAKRQVWGLRWRGRQPAAVDVTLKVANAFMHTCMHTQMRIFFCTHYITFASVVVWVSVVMCCHLTTAASPCGMQLLWQLSLPLRYFLRTSLWLGFPGLGVPLSLHSPNTQISTCNDLKQHQVDKDKMIKKQKRQVTLLDFRAHHC